MGEREILGTDLFGEPVYARREGPGRPAAVWNEATSHRVSLGFALGWTVKRVATLVGLSCPTLRKVYFSECAKRREARDRMDLRQLELLAKAAAEGSVAANKELDKRLEKLRVRELGETIVASRGKHAEAKSVRKGKKEQMAEAAEGVTGRFGPRKAPPLLVN